ncbi:MAG TPA: RNA polymerase sigma factor [Anaeromyxobacteraceae bacterium]|nr:RNA polymerase sigma factor [Anaeromyxobacteraceae bacterium]
MVRLAEAWGHDAEGAEQIARGAWRTILPRLSSFDGAGSLTAWLLRTVSEVASATAPLRRADPGDDGAARPGSPPGTVGDVTPDALHDALAALPPCERLAITLRDVEGLGPDDAAAVLGVTVATQHALLHRARAAVVRQIWSAGRPPDDTRRTGRDGA